VNDETRYGINVRKYSTADHRTLTRSAGVAGSMPNLYNPKCLYLVDGWESTYSPLQYLRLWLQTRGDGWQCGK